MTSENCNADRQIFTRRIRRIPLPVNTWSPQHTNDSPAPGRHPGAHVLCQCRMEPVGEQSGDPDPQIVVIPPGNSTLFLKFE